MSGTHIQYYSPTEAADSYMGESIYVWFGMALYSPPSYIVVIFKW